MNTFQTFRLCQSLYLTLIFHLGKKKTVLIANNLIKNNEAVSTTAFHQYYGQFYLCQEK